jgi:hypothetical protein
MVGDLTATMLNLSFVNSSSVSLDNTESSHHHQNESLKLSPLYPYPPGAAPSAPMFSCIRQQTCKAALTRTERAVRRRSGSRRGRPAMKSHFLLRVTSHPLTLLFFTRSQSRCDRPGRSPLLYGPRPARAPAGAPRVPAARAPLHQSLGNESILSACIPRLRMSMTTTPSSPTQCLSSPTSICDHIHPSGLPRTSSRALAPARPTPRTAVAAPAPSPPAARGRAGQIGGAPLE